MVFMHCPCWHKSAIASHSLISINKIVRIVQNNFENIISIISFTQSNIIQEIVSIALFVFVVIHIHGERLFWIYN